MANSVCYGDIIYLDVEEFILYSNGFFDSSLYFVSKKNISAKAFSYGLFKLYPNFSYKDMSQVENLKVQLDLLKSLNPEDKLAYEQLSRDLEQEKKALNLRDDKFDLLNDKIFKESNGKPIRYGQKIQLYHLESQRFVSPSNTSNPNQPGLINLELATSGNKNLYFSFMPNLRFIQEGEIVEYNVPLKVVSLKLDIPLVRGPEFELFGVTTELNPQSNNLLNNEENFSVVPPRRKEPLFQQKDIITCGIRNADDPENLYVRKYSPNRDQEDSRKKKAFLNGDYIRITNDKLYLTAYQGRDSDRIFFQGFNTVQDYKYNNLYTIFQIIEASDLKSNTLPHGGLLEYSEEKRYILRHLVSGKILGSEDGTLKLYKREEVSEDLETVSIIIKNKSKEGGKEKYLDKNSIMQIKFNITQDKKLKKTKKAKKTQRDDEDEEAEAEAVEEEDEEDDEEELERGVLSIGTAIKVPNGQLEINTTWFYGFKLTEDYLNKKLNTERFQAVNGRMTYTKSGKFIGYYKQYDKQEPIEGNYTMSNAYITIKTLDIVGHATWTGKVDKKTLQVEIVKKYYGAHCIYYRGKFDETLTCVTGSWSWDTVPRGAFQIHFKDDSNNDRSSSLKFAGLSKEETKSILLVESLTNQLTKFMDFLNDLLKREGYTFNDLNAEIIKLAEICKKFESEMYEGTYDKANEAALPPNYLIQTLLREFRTYDIIYRIFFYLVRDSELLKKVERLKAEASLKDLEGQKKKSAKPGYHRGATKAVDDIATKSEVKFSEILSCFKSLKKIITTSFRKNHLNRLYCSQFIKVLIESIVGASSGMFSLSEFQEKQEMKKIVLALCKKSLWKSDLDALGQLNSYESVVFQCIESQKSFHTIYLQLMEHIAKTKAPNLNNTIRDNFVKNFIKRPEIMEHVFPNLILDGSKVFVKFNRAQHPDNNHTLTLAELDKELLNSQDKDSEMKDRIRTETAYFISSLNLMAALVSFNAPVRDLMIVKYYRYEVLNQAVKQLKNSQDHQQIRFCIGKIISLVHHNFFSLPFAKLPNKLQILNLDPQMATMVNDIGNFIKISVNTSLSVSELHHMEKENVSDIVNALKTVVIADGDINEVRKLIKSDASTIKFEHANVIIEEIRKVLETGSDVPLDFLKDSHEVVLSLINQAATKKEKAHFEFIMQALEVFTLIEHKLVAHTATNIIAALSKDWETGERMYTVADKFNEITTIENTYKDFSTSQIVSTLLEVSLLNEDSILSKVIYQLKRIASYESLLFFELEKLTIVSDASSLKKVSDTTKMTFRLNEIAREVSFCNDSNIALDGTKLDKLLTEVLDHIFSLFFIIYDPSMHFRYSETSQNSEQRFKEAFVNTKTQQWDNCFKMNEDAINRPFQKIFNILKTSEVLLRTLWWILDKTTGFSEDQSKNIHAIRLIMMTMIVFMNKNMENQDVCSTTQDFIRLFYVQNFINQSCDSLQMFSEMMKSNKKLQKLPLKYLYDIAMSAFVGRLSDELKNDYSNSYLVAAIMSCDYLVNCSLPLDFFNPIGFLKQKWIEISKENEFSSLDIESFEDDIISLPHSYYAIRETMELTLRMIDHFEDDSRQLNEIKTLLSFQKWIEFFNDRGFCFQYELKNLLTRCISKIYFESGKKSKFTQDFQQSASIISVLVCEVVRFRLYVTEKENQNSAKLTNLTKSSNFLIWYLHYQNPLSEFDDKKLRIDMEDISLGNLLYEYIYGGCLDLLFHTLLSDVNTCKKIVNVQSETETIMDFVLLLLDEMIESEAEDDRFPRRKIEKFLNNANTTKGYEVYKGRIVALTSRLTTTSPKQKAMKLTVIMVNQYEIKGSSAVEGTPLDVFNRHLNVLKKNKRQLKEENIKSLADGIAQNSGANKIIANIMKYLKRDINKIKPQEIKFLLRLLRKYIERQNLKNSKDESAYKWKEVNHLDLRKINKIQQQLSDLGLTKLIYTFFQLSKPKVTKEALLLSLAYMYGGNRAIQAQFFDQLIEDDENKIINEFGKILKACWNSLRGKEGGRMEQLTISTQRNLFGFFKGDNLKTLTDSDLQTAGLEVGLDPKYLENADLDSKNQLFMLILTFFQSLCEGQYADMQNFLRNQEWKGVAYPNSFDLVGFLRHSVNSYHKVLNKYNLAVGNRVLALITELVQGEVQDNIRVFLNKTFIYDMCRIVTDYNSRYHLLPRGFGLDEFEENFRDIKSQVIFVFKTMVENRSESNIRLLKEHLDMLGLLKALASLMRNFIIKKDLQKMLGDVNGFVLRLSNEDFKDTLGDALNIYIIFRYLYDDTEMFNERMREFINNLDKDDQDFVGLLLFTIFKRLVTSIEIIADSKAEPLMTIWFPILAVCNYLHTETQATFLDRVDRSSSQTKIAALVDVTQEIVPQIYTDYDLRKKTAGFSIANPYPRVRLLTNLIGVVITFLNIGTYKLEADGSTTQDESYSVIGKVLNILQVFLASSLVVLWIIFFRTRHQSLMWERYVDENIKSIGFLPPTIKKKVDNGSFNELSESDCRLIMKLKGANSDEFKEMKAHAPKFRGISYSYLLLNTFFTFYSNALNWHLIYTGITIGSLLHPIVAVFQIFDIAIRSNTVKQVYSAVSKNSNQFLWTLFLLVVVNVVYSSVGFFFLNSAFVTGSDILCTTAFSCFMNTMNLGLRNGGGIGDVIHIQPYDPDDVGLFVWRVIFDMSFFIIMIILLLNLIFGMIIDSFGEIRDQKSSNDEDQKNVCFICGIERSEFERHTNYEEHILNDHNPWAYVYYIVYLLDRYKTAKVEMTDIENLVLEKYNQKDIGWIPIGKSLTLERIHAKEELKKEDEIEKLTKKVDFLTKKEVEKEEEIEKLMKKVDFITKKEIEKEGEIENLTKKIDFLVQCASTSKKE